ncbi:MAG: hypothetical protein QM586_08120, partial [Xenophilus sp.]
MSIMAWRSLSKNGARIKQRGGRLKQAALLLADEYRRMDAAGTLHVPRARQARVEGARRARGRQRR